jgi:hypothetical protein
MQLQLTKLVLILAMFISFQQITFAQNKKAIANTKAVTYQGIVYDDLPATLTITSDRQTGRFTLTVNLIGTEEEWSHDTEFSPNYDDSRMRFHGYGVGNDSGIFLYDISSDLGKSEKSVLSGYSYSAADNYEIRKMVFFIQ